MTTEEKNEMYRKNMQKQINGRKSKIIALIVLPVAGVAITLLLSGIGKAKQSELAKASGINLRTLQQYEIGAKDISKASVSTVLALSKVLERDVRDLCS